LAVHISIGRIYEQAQAIVDAYLDLEVIYPGMEGDISVYRKPRLPPPAVN